MTFAPHHVGHVFSYIICRYHESNHCHCFDFSTKEQTSKFRCFHPFLGFKAVKPTQTYCMTYLYHHNIFYHINYDVCHNLGYCGASGFL